MPQRAVKMVNAGVSAGSAIQIGGDVQDSVTATGATQATAAVAFGDSCIVTTAAAGTGVILGGPSFTSGDEVKVTNLGANALLVYPPLGGQINALAINAGFSVAIGKVAEFTARTDASKFVASVSA
jgi:hypothetical protein